MKSNTVLFPEQSETSIKKQITDFLKLSGCRVYRLQSGRIVHNVHGNQGGTLDLLTVTPAGSVWFVEIKKPGGRLRPDQEKEIKDLEKRGCRVLILDSVEDAKTIFYKEKK